MRAGAEKVLGETGSSMEEGDGRLSGGRDWASMSMRSGAEPGESSVRPC